MKIKDERFRTVLVITLGLLIWYYLKPSQYILITIIILVALASLSSEISFWIHIGWMKLAELLGYIMPNILLTLIYFILLFPIAQLAKLFRPNDLLRLNNSKPTTFMVRNKTYKKDDFLNPW